MNDSVAKLEHLKWLKTMGIEYYCSDKKDSKKLLIDEIKRMPKPEKTYTSVEISTSKENEKQFNTISPIKKEVKATHSKEEVAMPEATPEYIKNIATLEELKKAVEDFNGCELKNFASNTVFGQGNSESDILIVGEAPGAAEDEQGIPFCGESGILLDKMLESIGVSRKTNAYITNTIFWRPPANRRPTKEEISACRPFVEKHIALIDPKLIILVGATAADALLGKIKPSDKPEDNLYKYTNQFLNKEITTTTLFHPAYLLRQPSKKKVTWYELLKIKDFLIENKAL